MGANTFYLLDAGFNNLARPILYGSYHPMSIVPRGGDKSQRPLVDVVVGARCANRGTSSRRPKGASWRRATPREVGDLVAIENAGEYGAVMASNYNSKPLAAELLIRADRDLMPGGNRSRISPAANRFRRPSKAAPGKPGG